MENMMENLNLSVEEDDELIINDEVDGGQEGNIELCLVGRFITDQTLNFNFVRSRLASIWKPRRGVSIKEIGDQRMLIQFFHRLDLKRVTEGGPWSIGSHPLIIHQLKVGELPHSVPLNRLPFWVQIYNLPVGLFTESVGKSLGNFIGTFLEYDMSNRGAAWKPFMRIRVELDVNLPLKRGKKIRSSNGASSTVIFKYERLQLFCFICGRLGHTESACEVLFDAESDNVAREWGPFLKAPDRRSQFLGGERWLRDEKDKRFDSKGVSVPSPATGGEDDESSSDGDILDRVNASRKGKAIVTGSEILSEPFKIYRDSRETVDANRGILICNPCFEFSNSHEDIGEDDYTLNEAKKRKRMLSLHGSDEKHAELELMQMEATHNGNTSVNVHFLSADPGSGVCREQ